jgi:hypothetical protein
MSADAGPGAINMPGQSAAANAATSLGRRLIFGSLKELKAVPLVFLNKQARSRLGDGAGDVGAQRRLCDPRIMHTHSGLSDDPMGEADGALPEKMPEK